MVTSPEALSGTELKHPEMTQKEDREGVMGNAWMNVPILYTNMAKVIYLGRSRFIRHVEDVTYEDLEKACVCLVSGESRLVVFLQGGAEDRQRQREGEDE